jgi:dihydrofolate reductase
MRVSLIAALAKNRVIGNGNKLPWHLPEDLKRFKAITMGHPVVMGRRTFESIGRALPGRLNVVVSRKPHAGTMGTVAWSKSIDEALERASQAPGGEEVFVIGGAEIYKLALPRADRLYLTLIGHDVEGDAYFPEWSGFQETKSEPRTEPFGFRFTVWEKRDG